MTKSARLLAIVPVMLVLWVTGCQTNKDAQDNAMRVAPPAVAAPPRHDEGGPAGPVSPVPASAADLSEEGAVAWGSTEAVLIDTRRATPQLQLAEPGSVPLRQVKEILPRHKSRDVVVKGTRNDLPVGTLLDEPRTTAPRQTWPAIGQTGWTPPDPTLAVGPTHVVTTVNQSIGFYTRDGELEYSNYLNVNGNPGFFEPVGADDFTFDPKCFYDHYADRFVVLALEVYTAVEEAYVTIAVSDDSNPHGTWYKYRTDAVIAVGSTTYWWDYPGFGYDEDAYYVTSNLFGLNQSGWGGVAYRVFDKSPLLVGDTASYATLRDGSAGSVQVAQHFGDNVAPFFVSTHSTSGLRIQAIRNPLTAPTLYSTTVSVPYFDYPSDAPSYGAEDIWLIDVRIMNVHWRDGNLYATHHVRDGTRNFARWYHLDTGPWPFAGTVSLVQSGQIAPSGNLHSWFPAIYSNRFDEVSVVCGTSSSTERIKVNTTARDAADPPGTMGALVTVKSATTNGGGRWGDYYDIAIDPVDDLTFWVIGEYPESYGWANWIVSYRVTEIDLPYFDVFGTCMQGPEIRYDDGCAKSDLSEDGDVDLHDVAEMQRLFDA